MPLRTRPVRSGLSPWEQLRQLPTADGVRLAAGHVGPTSGHRRIGVVVAHGFTGSLADPGFRRVAGWLADSGIGVVGLDFRGHGLSGGRTTVGDREVLDLDAALRWLTGLGYPSVGTLGFSMGAAVVLRHAALLGGSAAVVSVSGPAQWYYRGTPAMRRAHLAIEHPAGRLASRWLRGTRIVPSGWDPLPMDPCQAAARVSVPLLVVHGEDDHYFPVDHAHRLAAAARSATLWVEPGFAHAESSVGRELVQRIAGWLVGSLDGAASHRPQGRDEQRPDEQRLDEQRPDEQRQE